MYTMKMVVVVVAGAFLVASGYPGCHCQSSNFEEDLYDDDSCGDVDSDTDTDADTDSDTDSDSDSDSDTDTDSDSDSDSDTDSNTDTDTVTFTDTGSDTDTGTECSFINRAELVKKIVDAVDGFATYEPPTTPTFTDVSVDAWYYDYVEAAVQLGIINGYTDEYGNLTGQFGPGDIVNRAAGVKIIVNAFHIPTDLDPGSPFSDTPPQAWYYDYVVMAFNAGMLELGDGLFRPADPATMCFVDYLIEKAIDFGDTDTDTGTGTDTSSDTGTDTNTDTSTIHVTLVNGGPVATSIPAGAVNANILFFSITTDLDLTVRSTDIVIRAYDHDGNPVGPDNEYVYGLLKTLRIVRNDTQSTVSGPMTTVSHGTRNESADGVWYTNTFAEDYELTAGEPEGFVVQANIDENFPSGYSFDVEISFIPETGTSYFFDYINHYHYLPTNEVQGNPLVSNKVSVYIGMLYATTNHLEGDILVAGTTNNLVSSYYFHAADEAFEIDKLSIVNDNLDDFGDAVESVRSIYQITIKYLDEFGVTQTRSALMFGGRASFSDLGFYIPKDGMAPIDIYADLYNFSTCGMGIYDGFRVGIDQITNFVATGRQSAHIQDTFEILDDNSIPGFGVRQNKPYFEKMNGSYTLVNGINTLYGLIIYTYPYGSTVFLKELYFGINSNIQVSNFELWRGPTLTTATFDYTNGTLTVFFDPQEGIAAGESQAYFLRAEVTGVMITGDFIVTSPPSILWNDNVIPNIMGANKLASHTLSY